jgi:hypothetical protein
VVAITANSFDSDDDISTALGPETLAERDMVSEGFDNIVSVCAAVLATLNKPASYHHTI